MPDSNPPSELQTRRRRRSTPPRWGLCQPPPPLDETISIETDVGRHLRGLRSSRGLSIRALAEQSGLSTNTLSLIENGRTSPSVSTLKHLAEALSVPITAFFENDGPRSCVTYQRAGQRQPLTFAFGVLEDLGTGLTLRGGRPLLITLKPKASSGPIPIVHTGHEFIYCLEGQLSYIVDETIYHLHPGDSLLFEAHIPHCWQNSGEVPSISLLVMCPADDNDHPIEHHFGTV